MRLTEHALAALLHRRIVMWRVQRARRVRVRYKPLPLSRQLWHRAMRGMRPEMVVRWLDRPRRDP